MTIDILDTHDDMDGSLLKEDKKRRKLRKKLCSIECIERKVQTQGANSLDDEEKKKLLKKKKVETALEKLPKSDMVVKAKVQPTSTTLSSLYEASDDKIQLAMEYLDLATRYPVKIRSVIFHVRRMLKDDLVQYQLMEDCLSSDSLEQVRAILLKMKTYRADPASFIFDKQKAKKQKEALERKRREEGKRKAYEARMIRKAKREGKTDLHHYLHIGAEVPTRATINKLKALPKDDLMIEWKKQYSQHCLAFHMDAKGCQRGRTCAFLHVDTKGSNVFNEKDEVAG